MTFCEMKGDEIPRPKRALQRTPPKPKQPSPPISDGAFGDGSGHVSRDDPVPSIRSNKGPVQRSPIRKVEDNYTEKKKIVDTRNYDYLDDIKIESNIERKEKLRRSPVDTMRNPDFSESSPNSKRSSMRQNCEPLTINPLKTGNEFRQANEFYENNIYPDISPQKHYFGSPQTQKVHYDTSELTNFEDRVDDLLCETRNILDDYTPKTDQAQPSHDLNFQKQSLSYAPMDAMSSYSQNDFSMDQGIQPPMAGMIMHPGMPQSQVYRQQPYQMAYYAPMPMTQGMVPPQGYIQPQAMYATPTYSQEMLAPNTMASAPQPQYQPQMVPASMLPTNSQPMYQVFYPQAAAPTSQQQPPQQNQYSPQY